MHGLARAVRLGHSPAGAECEVKRRSALTRRHPWPRWSSPWWPSPLFRRGAFGGCTATSRRAAGGAGASAGWRAACAPGTGGAGACRTEGAGVPLTQEGRGASASLRVAARGSGCGLAPRAAHRREPDRAIAAWENHVYFSVMSTLAGGASGYLYPTTTSGKGEADRRVRGERGPPAIAILLANEARKDCPLQLSKTTLTHCVTPYRQLTASNRPFPTILRTRHKEKSGTRTTGLSAGRVARPHRTDHLPHACPEAPRGKAGTRTIYCPPAGPPGAIFPKWGPVSSPVGTGRPLGWPPSSPPPNGPSAKRLPRSPSAGAAEPTAACHRRKALGRK